YQYCIDLFLVIFFKQKTAYDLFTSLEFRRVLFRSLRRATRDRRPARAARARDRPARPPPGSRAGGTSPRSGAGRTRGPGGAAGRSEERRVGEGRNSRLVRVRLVITKKSTSQMGGCS